MDDGARAAATAPEPVDPKEYLLHAPQEPLVPPVIFASAEPAPGSVPTAETLLPPVVEAPAGVPAPGSTQVDAPLTPPVVNQGVPAPAE